MKNNPVAVIQARMGSSRLPGKVLRDIAGKPMLWHVVQRVREANPRLKVLVTCPASPPDMAILAMCNMHDIPCYTHKGDADDVLDRYYAAATTACLQRWGVVADPVVRITADCPLVDPALIKASLEKFLASELAMMVAPEIGAYTPKGVFSQPGYPDGLDVEVIRLAALRMAWANAVNPKDREHVTPFLWRRHRTECGKILNHDMPHDNTKFSVDTEDDLLRVQAIYDTHYKKPDAIFPASRFLETYAND